MPSTNEATLQLIQQEISEVIQRERELKEKYTNSQQTVMTNGVNGTIETKSASSVPITNGKKNGRLFTPNPTTKGVMQRFIKSKGKLSNLSSSSNTVTTSKQTFANLEFYDATSPIIPAGSATRNGFVPINERIKKEFVEMEKREVELQLERRKSQSDLVSLYEGNSPELKRSFQSSMSISQISDCDSYQGSSGSSLKPAKSLADLCNLENEEIESPGSLTLIKQWETIIQKNQVRT